MTSSIGKIFHTVAKNVDVQDVAKAANSRQVREAAGDALENIGEALANSTAKNGTDIASTFIEEGAEAVTTSTSKKGFWGWLKGLFSSSSSSSTPDIPAKNLSSEAVEQTSEDLQNQILELQKQNKKLQKANNKMQKANNKAQKKIKKLNENVEIYKSNMSEQQIKQAEVDQMSWLQKLFSSECKFNWDLFKWEAC